MPCIDLKISPQPLRSSHQGCCTGKSDYKRKWSDYYTLTLDFNLICVSILIFLIILVFSLRASGRVQFLRSFTLKVNNSFTKFVILFVLVLISVDLICNYVSEDCRLVAEELQGLGSRLVAFCLVFVCCWWIRCFTKRLLLKRAFGFSGKFGNWWFVDKVCDLSIMCCCVFEDVHINVCHGEVPAVENLCLSLQLWCR